MKLGLRFLAVVSGISLVAACSSDDGGGGGSGGTPSSGGSTAGGGSSATGGTSATGGAGGTSSGGVAGTSSGGTSATGGAAGSASGGTSSGGTSSGGTSSGGAAGASAIAECKAKAAGNPDPACANCACENCLSALAACEADPTCVDLRNCAQKNKCCDELCVLMKCSTELSKAGGASGAGTAKAAAVKDCTVKAACNCCK